MVSYKDSVKYFENEKTNKQSYLNGQADGSSEDYLEKNSVLKTLP